MARLFTLPLPLCGKFKGTQEAPFTPLDLGDDLKLWLRPEELVNPNRLLQTADLEDVSWTVASTAIASGQTDPDAGSTAFLLTPSANPGRIEADAIGFQPLADDTFSFYIKRGPSHDGTSQYRIQISDGVANTSADAVPPETWTRIDITRTLHGAASTCKVEFYPSRTGNTGVQGAVFIWHPQLESGDTATPYQANIATAGGVVASWADQGGTGNNATQATQARMPLVQLGVLDGHSGALFDGVDDTLALDSTITETGAHELWVVALPIDLSANNVVFGGADAIKYPCEFEIDGSMRYRNDGGNAVIAVAGTVVADSSLLIRIQRDGSDNLLVEKNGVDVTTAGPPNQGSDMTVIRLSGRDGDSLFFTGSLLEAISVSGVLSAGNVVNMDAYFASRYPTLGI